MTILRTDTISGIGTEGTVLEGDITIDSLNYMTLPKGTTDQRYSLEGRDPDYHKLKLHLPLVHHTQFDDYSPASPSITANYDSHISSKSGVFENSAALFSRSGSNDWLSISDSTDNDLGSDDFTIECWFMCTAGGTNGYLVQKGTVSGNWSYFIQFREATDSINFYGTSDGTNFDIANGTSFGATISPNRWYHVAVCRSGNTFSYYINGKKGSTEDTSSASFHNSNVDVRIPEAGGFGSTEDVFLQDIRLYKGVAKYSETFTPQKLAEDGAIRYNTDSNKIECYDGTKWMQISVSSPDLGNSTNSDNHGGNRGFIVGGTTPGSYTNKIEYFNIDTVGNTIDFDTLASATSLQANVSDSTRLCTFGDYDSPNTSMSAAIDYITMASTGSRTSFGNFSEGRYSAIPVSSSTRGIWMGGTNVYNSVSGTQAGIEYVTIQSTGNTTTFGNLTQKASTGQGFQSPTRGIAAGGWDPTGSGTRLDNIQHVTMASTGNTQDFGNLVVASGFGCGNTASNSIRGLVTLGNTSPGTYENVLQYINITTLGDAVEFGDLARGAEWTCGCASPTRAVFHNPGGNTNAKHMDYVAIATQGNAVDFGDTTEDKGRSSAGSNAHGGL